MDTELGLVFIRLFVVYLDISYINNCLISTGTSEAFVYGRVTSAIRPFQLDYVLQ